MNLHLLRHPRGLPSIMAFRFLVAFALRVSRSAKSQILRPSPATTETLLSSRRTIAVLDWCGKFLASPTSKRSALSNQTGGVFGVCLSLTLWRAATMPEGISNQYFLNSRSDGKNGVKSTRRPEVRTKQGESGNRLYIQVK